MTANKGYDVLRLIEHGQTCYISSEYVEGKILANWLKYHPHISKEQLLGWIQTITKQLGMIHKCRKKPCYQYVNPYSIVISEEGSLYFLDLDAKSNEEQLRFMQRRMVREYFLPAEAPYYQKASIGLDIFGLGKTIQYLLAVSDPAPSLSRGEERKFQKVISRCLKRHSKKTYQQVTEIRKHLPTNKKRNNSINKIKIVFMTGIIALLSAFCIAAYSQDDNNKENKQKITTGEIEDDNVLSRAEAEEIKNAYLEIALEYFLELDDYRKSLYYLEKIQEENELAESLSVIIESVLKEEAKEDQEMLESHLKKLEEIMPEEEKYYRCLIRGYGLSRTDSSAENILRLGKRYIAQEVIEKKNEKEIKEYMASAYEELEKAKDAAKLYEELLKQEEDERRKEELFKKIAVLYESCEEVNMALDTCVQGIKELDGSEELRLLHIRLLCKDTSIDRSICAQTIKEYTGQMPEILENEEFQKLQREYEIRIEGEEVWVGSSNG